MSFDRKAGNGCPSRVVSPETMIGAVLEMGIVPFFANAIPAYSIEEMTAPENWFDTQEDLSFTPWDWKIPCVQSGQIAYGKFLWSGKAAFATVEWYRELMNYRRSLPKYAPNASEQQILAYLEENGSIGIKEVRGLLGVKKGAADALISHLMMQCRVVTGDITRVYRGPDLHYNGWQVSSFCTPEALFGLSDEAAAGKPTTFFGFPCEDSHPARSTHTPAESRSLLTEHNRSHCPTASAAQIARMLG